MSGLPSTWSEIRRAPWRQGAPPASAQPRPAPPPSMAAVVRAVAGETGVAAADLLGTARDRRSAAARMIAMARCVNEGGRSLSAVGRYFGRHHTTVLHAVRRSAAGEGRGR